MRPRRVLLFMPGDSRRKIEKGISFQPDSIIMDLEDGVAFNAKADARAGVAAALRELDFGRSERLVRINPVGSGLEMDDLAETAHARPDGYLLPKVESAAQVMVVDAHLARVETAHGWPEGGIRLIALVETARGIVNLREIAESSPRLDALAFGAEDLAGDLGARRTKEGWEGFYARSAVVLHAKAYGLQAIDTPFVALDDPAGLEADARTAAGMGYTGKLAIHPNHIAPILAAFTPSEEEIRAARELVAAYEAHQAAGSGVFVVNGKMIDMPMIRAARAVLARAGLVDL